jgi:hypothetical protein
MLEPALPHPEPDPLSVLDAASAPGIGQFFDQSQAAAASVPQTGLARPCPGRVAVVNGHHDAGGDVKLDDELAAGRMHDRVRDDLADQQLHSISQLLTDPAAAELIADPGPGRRHRGCDRREHLWGDDSAPPGFRWRAASKGRFGAADGRPLTGLPRLSRWTPVSMGVVPPPGHLQPLAALGSTGDAR